MNTLALSIITPDREVFAGEVVSVTVPGSEEKGQFQVLYNHAPIVSTLQKGHVKYVTADKAEHKLMIDGGVVEVMKNKVNVLVERLLESAN